jgi:hypothetical protein
LLTEVVNHPFAPWGGGDIYYSFQKFGVLTCKQTSQVIVSRVLSWFFLLASSTCVLIVIMAEFKSKVKNKDLHDQAREILTDVRDL